jgi:hypothetical protein
MSRLFLILFCISFLGSAAFGQVAAEPVASTPDPTVIAEKVAPYEKVLATALGAYNERDVPAFLATLAKEAHPPATENSFHAIFDGIYRVEFGKFISKELVPAESIPDPNYGQVVYKATFEKRTRVKVSADFIREDGVLKIVQLRFEKM